MKRSVTIHIPDALIDTTDQQSTHHLWLFREDSQMQCRLRGIVLNVQKLLWNVCDQLGNKVFIPFVDCQVQLTAKHTEGEKTIHVYATVQKPETPL